MSYTLSILKEFGFIECYDTYYHPQLSFEISLDNENCINTIIVDGIDNETAADWLILNREVVSLSLLDNLKLWITAQRNVVTPGICEDNNEDGNEDVQFTKFIDLPVNKDRNLVIYTRGKAIMKTKPKDSQCSFNAAVLDCRGGGVDLRKMNGLHPEVQRRLLSCYTLPRWLVMFVEKVETNDYNCVDVFCTKGRHRSVAVAELLKTRYYPNAIVKHLTIR